MKSEIRNGRIIALTWGSRCSISFICQMEHNKILSIYTCFRKYSKQIYFNVQVGYILVQKTRRRKTCYKIKNNWIRLNEKFIHLYSVEKQPRSCERRYICGLYLLFVSIELLTQSYLVAIGEIADNNTSTLTSTGLWLWYTFLFDNLFENMTLLAT